VGDCGDRVSHVSTLAPHATYWSDELREFFGWTSPCRWASSPTGRVLERRREGSSHRVAAGTPDSVRTAGGLSVRDARGGRRVVVGDDHPPADLESREPSVEDLVELCRWLNEARAKYLVVGGFAVRAAGYDRRTMDIDLLIEPGPQNEARVFAALAHLPDRAVDELSPGEVEKYAVVRVADEIVIDLMSTASGIAYADAASEIAVHEIHGVSVPFASPRLLYRMKRGSLRDKDAPDLHFLRRLLGTEADP
jgi:hypothetical protein